MEVVATIIVCASMFGGCQYKSKHPNLETCVAYIRKYADFGDCLSMIEPGKACLISRYKIPRMWFVQEYKETAHGKGCALDQGDGHI